MNIMRDGEGNEKDRTLRIKSETFPNISKYSYGENKSISVNT